MEKKLFGLTLLRISVGLSMLSHGWPKLLKFSALSSGFPDPLGLGSTSSLILVIFAEVVCSAMLVLGLGTRLVAVPLLVTMVVAFFLVHSADPFAKRELAALYGVVYGTLIIEGGGRFQLGKKLGALIARYS